MVENVFGGGFHVRPKDVILMIVQGKLLRPTVVRFAKRISGNCKYQDDNARQYRACVAVNFLRQHGVRNFP